MAATRSSRRLTAVEGAGQQPTRARRPTANSTKLLPQLAEGKTERDIFLALRRKLAAQIDGCNRPTALAPLVRQFREIDAKLRGLEQAAEEGEGEESDDGGYGGTADWDEADL